MMFSNRLRRRRRRTSSMETVNTTIFPKIFSMMMVTKDAANIPT
jgi:hypothetical protein